VPFLIVPFLIVPFLIVPFLIVPFLIVPFLIVPFLITTFLISTAALPITFDIRVGYAHMPRESVVTRESLLFATHRTSDSLLTVTVNSVFVPRKIIRPREELVAGLIG
jgi:hypothetical protein